MSVDELLALNKLQRMTEYERVELERCLDSHLRFSRFLAICEHRFDSLEGHPSSHRRDDLALDRSKFLLSKHLVRLIDVAE